VDKSRTGQLSDATGDFVCLVFVLLTASARPRVAQSASWLVCELSSPWDVQSASWQSASWHIRELSSYLSRCAEHHHPSNKQLYCTVVEAPPPVSLSAILTTYHHLHCKTPNTYLGTGPQYLAIVQEHLRMQSKACHQNSHHPQPACKSACDMPRSKDVAKVLRLGSEGWGEVKWVGFNVPLNTL